MKARSSLRRLVLVFLVTAPAIGPSWATARAETTGKVVVARHPRVVVVRTRRTYGTETFTLANDAKVLLGSSVDASLTDLRVGETAHVSYTVEDGTWLAHEIVVNPPQSSQGGNHPQHTYQKNEQHAHGVIVGYNADAGTLTIRHRR